MIDLTIDDFKISDDCFDCRYFKFDACLGWHLPCGSLNKCV